MAELPTGRKQLLIFCAAGAVLFLFPILIKRDDYINLMILIFLFTILAQSWNILAGYAGQVSLGHAAFFGIGAVATRVLWYTGLPYVMALFAGGIIAGCFSLAIGIPALRLRGIYFAIGTLVLAEIFRITIGNILPTVTPFPVEALVTYTLVTRYYLCLVLALITVTIVFIISNSKLGLGMVAVREDVDTAEASGVNTFRVKVMALIISSFLAGLAGGAYAYYQVSFYYDMPFSPIWTFDAMLIAFVGGVGTITGPIIGSLFYAIIREAFALTMGQMHVLVFGVLFVLVVLLLPGGLVEVVAKGRRFFSGFKAKSI